MKSVADSPYGLTRRELATRYPAVGVGDKLQALRRRGLVMYDRASMRWVVAG